MDELLQCIRRHGKVEGLDRGVAPYAPSGYVNARGAHGNRKQG
jgi:hypothetical protein